MSDNKVLNKATVTFSECEDILLKKLAGENLDIFIKAVNAADDMAVNLAIDNFSVGAKLSAKLMIEILM